MDWGEVISTAITVLGTLGVAYITYGMKRDTKQSNDDIGAKVQELTTKVESNAQEIAKVRADLTQNNIQTTRSELESCKNFLVRFLADVEQGQPIDEIELERFHEVYARYTSPELNGNSYIHSKVEKLKAQGKL